MLDSAETAGAITALGKALRSDIEKLIAIEQGNYGMLSQLGKQELTNIGKRTASQHQALFAQKPKITAVATIEKRAQESRDLFVQGLQSQTTIEVTSFHYEEEQDPYLRPYDVAPLYIEHEEGKGWEDLFKEYEENELGITYA